MARNRSKPSIWQAGSPPVGKAPRHKSQGMLQKALSPSSHPLLQAGRNTGSSRSFISLFDFPCSGSQSLKSMDGSLKERENKPSHCLNSFTARFPCGKHDWTYEMFFNLALKHRWGLYPGFYYTAYSKACSMGQSRYFIGAWSELPVPPIQMSQDTFKTLRDQL